MSETVYRKPPRSLLVVWESLPEGTLSQIIKNRLVMSPMPIDIHQKVIGAIASKIYGYVDENYLGQVRMGLYDVHLDEENIFQPDMFYISKQNTYKISDHLYGAPDLIVEVLSPSNANYDKVDKKEIYEKYGVKEYFIVEPTDKSVISYLLVNDEFVQRETKPGEIESELLRASFTF